MKKFFFIFCVFLLFGCGKKTPLEKCRERVVEIGEKYLEFEISASEAKEQLDSIIVPESNGAELRLEVYKSSLELDLIKIDLSKNINYEKIEETVNKIKNLRLDN